MSIVSFQITSCNECPSSGLQQNINGTYNRTSEIKSGAPVFKRDTGDSMFIFYYGTNVWNVARTTNASPTKRLGFAVTGAGTGMSAFLNSTSPLPTYTWTTKNTHTGYVTAIRSTTAPPTTAPADAATEPKNMPGAPIQVTCGDGRTIDCASGTAYCHDNGPICNLRSDSHLYAALSPSKKLNGGQIAGIVVGCVAVTAVVGYLVVYYRRYKKTQINYTGYDNRFVF